MNLLKKVSSVAMTFAVVLGTIMPTSTLPLLANEESNTLKVSVVGEGSVAVKDIEGEKIEFALQESPLEETYTKGKKLVIDCVGTDTIVSSVQINDEDKKIEEAKAEFEFDFKIEEDTEIKVTFDKAANEEIAKRDAETQDSKDESPDQGEEKPVEQPKQETQIDGEIASTEEVVEEEIPTDTGIKIDFSKSEMTEQDKEVIRDYAAGNIEKWKEARFAKAKDCRLEEYIDEDGFLTKKFFEIYPPNVLLVDGLYLLDPSGIPEKQDALIFDEVSVAAVRALTVRNLTLHRFNNGAGYYMNGLWDLSNGAQAFCAEARMANPEPGTQLSNPSPVDNADLRRALYYGYSGPGNVLGNRFGLNGSAQVVVTNDFVSHVYSGTSVAQLQVNGYHWNLNVRSMWEHVKSLPDPAQYGYRVVMVTSNGSGNNIFGQPARHQSLVYGEYAPKGNLHLRKKSANTAITDGNNCYSLQGAEYGLYSDAKCTNLVYKFSTDANGWADKDGFDAGTYYLKELKAPKGYALDPKVHTIQIKAGETTTYGSKNELVDIPQSDPINILLGKVDRLTNQNKPQGSGTLEGAEFTIKFFAGSNPNTSGKATRTWVMRTDKSGKIRLTDAYKVSGDPFYLNSKDVPTLPLGTLTIQETKAPHGYYINNEIFVRTITASGGVEEVHTYNEPTVKEQPNELTLNKVQIGTDKPIEGTIFTHTLPDGSTEDVTTDADGNIKFVGLAHGTHKIKEKVASDGYIENPHEITFTVFENGIEMNTDLADKNIEWKPGRSKSPSFTLQVNEELDDYKLKLIKINDKDAILPGAEFTIYEDKECTKAIETLTTNETGILVFDNLKDRQTYYFKETKAPAGYRIPVDSKGNVHVYELRTEFTPTEGIYDFFVDGQKYTVANTEGSVHLEDENGTKVVAITVINYISGKLPETGSNTTLILMLVGASLLCLFALRKRFAKNTD